MPGGRLEPEKPLYLKRISRNLFEFPVVLLSTASPESHPH
jgi:hypothetical protein